MNRHLVLSLIAVRISGPSNRGADGGLDLWDHHVNPMLLSDYSVLQIKICDCLERLQYMFGQLITTRRRIASLYVTDLFIFVQSPDFSMSCGHVPQL